MSRVLATFDVQSKDWTFNTDNVAPTYTDVYIRLRRNGSRNVEARNAVFGCRLTDLEDRILSQFIFPMEGTKFYRTDQDFLCSFRLTYEPNTTYKLKLYMYYKGQYDRFERNITTPVEQVV